MILDELLTLASFTMQFWVSYASCNTSMTDAVRVSLDALDNIKKFVRRYSEVFEFVTTAQGEHVDLSIHLGLEKE